MNSQEERDALWLLESFKRHGIDPARGVSYLVRHALPAHAMPIGNAFARFLASLSCGDSHRENLENSGTAFIASLPAGPATILEVITSDDLERFLVPYGTKSRKTFNHVLADLAQFFRWCVRKQLLVRGPHESIDRKPIRHDSIPSTIDPARVANIMAELERSHPQWCAYFAFGFFAGLRPCVREGESFRLNEDLRGGPLGRHPFTPDCFFVRRKTGKTRPVFWSSCGPLRSWLTAYPCDGGLLPDGLSPSQAERRLQALRSSFGIGYDEVRHTACSWMINAPGASFAQVSLTVDNSETIMRRHYVGLYTAQQSLAVAGIRPRLSLARSAVA